MKRNVFSELTEGFDALKAGREGLNLRIPAAEKALPDRTVLSINSTAYARFLARLDAPPKPNQRLRRTMRAKPPWRP